MLFTACESDIVVPSFTDETATTSSRAVYSSRSINWNNRTDGTYTQTEAITDFGNISGYNEARIINSGGTTRVKLEKNLLSDEGGGNCPN